MRRHVQDIDNGPRGADGLTDRERYAAWRVFRAAQGTGGDGSFEAFKASLASKQGGADERPAATDAPAPQRLGGRALYSRRTAPLGHPAPRTDAERSQKLSGRALMIARQANGGRQLGVR